MQLALIEDILKLLFLHNRKRVEFFTAVFDQSEFLVGFNYSSSLNRFTHLSLSFYNILGYNVLNFIDKKDITEITHPNDLPSVEKYLGNDTFFNNFFQGYESFHIHKMKVRARHLKGYWKHIIILSIDYWNEGRKSRNKMGLLIDERFRKQLIPFSDMVDIPENVEDEQKAAASPDNQDQNTIIITPREAEVLQLISEGLIAKEIAEKLYIGINTVITHRKNLISKFQVRNTAELIKKATRLMIV